MKLKQLLPLFAFMLVVQIAGIAEVARAGELQDKAASLAPGSWATLSQGGDGSGYGVTLLQACMPDGTNCTDNILNYASKGYWNPNTRELHFIGQGHLREVKHISYLESANRWQAEPKPSWDCSDQGDPTCYKIGHAYEHSTLDPATGNIYVKWYYSTRYFKWIRATRTWVELPAGPRINVAAAIEWFPELNGIVAVGAGEVHFYSESTGQWTTLRTGLTMGPYHNMAHYSGRLKSVIFGGGNDSSDLYRLSADRSISKLPNAPVPLVVRAALLVEDPATGNFLLFGPDGTFHEFDPIASTWRALSAAAVPIWAPEGNKVALRAAVPISTFGVIAILTYYNSESSAKVFLYRHGTGVAPAPADRMPPSPPTGLRAN